MIMHNLGAQRALPVSRDVCVHLGPPEAPVWGRAGRGGGGDRSHSVAQGGERQARPVWDRPRTLPEGLPQPCCAGSEGWAEAFPKALRVLRPRAVRSAGREDGQPRPTWPAPLPPWPSPRVARASR